MCDSDSQAGSTIHLPLDAQCSSMHRPNIVDDESDWRVLRQSSVMPLSPSKVHASRWQACRERSHELSAETPADRHIIKIALRNTNIWFSVSGRTVQDGLITAGTVHISEPGAQVHCMFRAPYDVLHLHVPNILIAECARDMNGRLAPELRSKCAPSKDMIVDSLGRALLDADRLGDSSGRLYADCISIAIVTRLLASTNRIATSERPKVGALARWRLKRAIDFIEARLDKTVSLADMASSAGLTRMHFAAQFRSATGLRPHEYLLRRRIERAQEMLLGSGMSLVDVARSVGFQTQAHFTGVFKRYAGQSPRVWRDSRAFPASGR
jgi:AraC family transcriptional regulator